MAQKNNYYPTSTHHAFCHFIDLPLMHNYPVCLTLLIQALLNFPLKEISLIILPQAIPLLPFLISLALVH